LALLAARTKIRGHGVDPGHDIGGKLGHGLA
jgi:hypothetical protein